MTFYEKNGVIALESESVSYLMKIENNRIYNMYFGKRLHQQDISALRIATPDSGFTPSVKENGREIGCFNNRSAEYSGYGMGDFRTPFILAEYAGGTAIDFNYRSYRIEIEKPSIDGMPSLRDGQSLVITLEDSSGLEIELFYSIYDEGAVSRRAVLHNKSNSQVHITKLMSGGLAIESGEYDIIELCGRYAKEHGVSRAPLGKGIFKAQSTRGISSHECNPFMAIASKNATEDFGEVYGINLIYSGNFQIEAQQDENDRIRVVAGINEQTTNITLNAGEEFSTPEVVFVYSENGLGELSRNFHDLYRNHLINPRFAHSPRPIVINNWESTYFDFDEKKILGIIESVKDSGVDTFVLDDGWFGHRNNDTTSLGDWFVNNEKLPNGLDSIIKCCEDNGLKFGLWFEPEMISEDSELFRSHPDWYVHTDNKPDVLGRNQFVLDFSKEEVVEYIYNCIKKLLDKYRISYIKLDMNRSITCAPDVSYYHKHVLGVYRLLENLTKQYPDVMIEGCSGGGGRFDAGMLYYCPQIWTSDNTDPYCRASIIYGTSFCYPMSSIINHVGKCPNPSTSRTTSFKTRGDIMSLGTFGYELNPIQLTDEQREMIKKQIKHYHSIEKLILDGDVFRLNNPFNSDIFGIQVVSKDKKEAYAVIMFGHRMGGCRNEFIKFKGLDEEAVYHITELDIECTGSALMHAGISVPGASEDFVTYTYHLNRI